MYALTHFFANHPLLSILLSASSAAINNALRQDLIPDGIQEVTMYTASVLGLMIAALTLTGMIRKEYNIWKDNHKKN